MTQVTPKLTTEQKADLKEMKYQFKRLGGYIFQYPEFGLTLGVIASTASYSDEVASELATSLTADVTVALLGPGDKWRKKTGQYTMLQRTLVGFGSGINTVTVPVSFAKDDEIYLDTEDFSGQFDQDISEVYGSFNNFNGDYATREKILAKAIADRVAGLYM